MRQRTWKEQSRHISELERRNRALLADASGAKEILRLEKAIADRDAAIAKLEERLVAKDAAIESLKAANSLLSAAGRKSKAETQVALRRCARLEKANASLESRLHDAEDRAWESSEKRREAEERAKAAERLLDSERRDHAAQITDKDEQIARLLQKLSKDCTNSSLPPSLCPNVPRKVCNSRERTGRLPGGQPGHEGHRRKQYEPDATVMLDGAAGCPACGCRRVPTGKVRTHTVTDIEVTLRTVAYVSSERKCLACGKRTWDAFPELAANESNYGPGVKAAATYLMNGCNVSKEKARDFLYEVTGGGLDVSSGSMTNFVRQMERRTEEDVAIRGSYVGILEDAIAAYEQAMPENPKYRPDGYPLAKRMLEYADAHLLFLRDASVPYTNNLSERLLRVSKGKMKQSGGFRSTANGERPYCAYLTVTETAKARGGSPYAAVRSAFSG